MWPRARPAIPSLYQIRTRSKMTEMILKDENGRTLITGSMPVSDGRIKISYHAGFYPSGAAVTVRVGVWETIVNPADTAVYTMLDRLSRQREVDVIGGDGQRVTIAHGRMARQQLQAILQRTAVHLPGCRLDWQKTLADFLA